jgi:hypothetical protein
MSCLPSRIPSSAWGHLLTKVAKSSLPKTAVTVYHPDGHPILSGWRDETGPCLLVGFYHACLGFPVKQTWLGAIKAGNCDTFEGLKYANAAKYCPDADKMILGHLAQQMPKCQVNKTQAANPGSAGGSAYSHRYSFEPGFHCDTAAEQAFHQ